MVEKIKKYGYLAVFGVLFETELYANTGAVAQFINYYEIILKNLGVGKEEIHEWMPVLGSVLALIVITTIGIIYKKRIEKKGKSVFPENRVTIENGIEAIMEMLYGIGESFCGHNFRKHLTLICGIFIYILVCNLSGLVPGFPPPTESINTNLAMGIIVFLTYNYSGVKEHGAKYLKQFTGPVVFIAPFFFVIEMFSHFARPFSLSLRLMGNIFGDHLVVAVFTGLTYIIVPAFLLFFGLLVAFIQSFLFTLLSSLYISMAISHDH